MSERQTKIIECLKAEFSPTYLEVVDFSAEHAGHAEAVRSGGGHFSVEISSSELQGLSRVKAHRRVSLALKELFDSGEIHALTIKVAEPAN